MSASHVPHTFFSADCGNPGGRIRGGLGMLLVMTLAFQSGCSGANKPAAGQFETASQEAVTSSGPAREQTGAAKTVLKEPIVKLVADFEGEELVNNLGGGIGDWNMDPEDINNSFTDLKVVSLVSKEGTESRGLSLTYSVDSDRSAANGFWTKLEGLDGSQYDHLAFELKGDGEKGFTEKFRIELKKCKDPGCRESVRGSAVIPVTAEWQTVMLPLNKLTGLIDFAKPESWENPLVGYTDLNELIFIFNDKFVTRKQGRIYVDNIRFVKTGDPGPSAVDQPQRFASKTTIPHGTVEFARFLAGRLRGFPRVLTVKKDLSQDPREFLREVAHDTWKFFDEIMDAENHMPLDNIQLGEADPLGEGVWIGDYTNVTNVGVYFMAVVSAYDLGFLTREEAVGRIQMTLAAVEKLEFHASGFPYNYYDTTLMDPTSFFVSFVDSGWLLLGLYVARSAFPEELNEAATKMIARGNFEFFYDPIERQMFHGYYANLGVYSDYHYGVFYAEPRAATYMAIARGDIPEEHWFEGPVRTFPENYDWQGQIPKGRITRDVLGYQCTGGHYEWRGLQYVPSWGGSAFEALMPAIVLKEKTLAAEGLGKNNALHVQGQIRYALEELGLPVWGMSPCSVPGGGYAEYGAKPFGIKGYQSGVVTPHASVLALEYAPEQVIANLRKLLELYDLYGEYGFYDSVDVATGKVARKYLALDQGMILIAINNYLNDGVLRERFHADPQMKKAEKLLSEEKFFEAAPAAVEAAPQP
ncbi:MAG: DUF3131 domain-containing protein [Candidatus Omnitrophica bacterium]|nr:DUF3131 domain-containing protein [Candidatus Omnitrophota bacterium]